MTIQIPQGAKTMQLFDMNIDIPEGKTYIDICRRKNKNTPQKNKNTLFGVILFFYKA
ncbi:hypothetical protein JYF68_001593 [Campylobacter coli]|nr:hypothetical protein [Campylobacter coli]